MIIEPDGIHFDSKLKGSIDFRIKLSSLLEHGIEIYSSVFSVEVLRMFCSFHLYLRYICKPNLDCNFTLPIYLAPN